MLEACVKAPLGKTLQWTIILSGVQGAQKYSSLFQASETGDKHQPYGPLRFKWKTPSAKEAISEVAKRKP